MKLSWWSQDLTTNDRGHAKRVGGIWRHGRGRVRFNAESGFDERSLGLEWAFWWPNTTTSLSVSLDRDESPFTFHVGVTRLASIWVHPHARWLVNLAQRALPNYEPRAISIVVRDGGVHWCLWMDPHSWSSADSHWRRGSFNVADWLLGRRVYDKHVIEEHQDVPIPLPERSYLAERIELAEETWLRPRWPWWPSATKLVRAHVAMREDLPIPGRDSSDDALSGATFVANSLSEAIGGMVQAALSRRLRIGRSVYAGTVQGLGPARLAEIAEGLGRTEAELDT